MRTEWVAQRSRDSTPTQIYYGRQGVVTEEMEYVAGANACPPKRYGMRWRAGG